MIKHIMPHSWTAVCVYEEEYLEMKSYYCSSASVCSQVLDELLVLILPVKYNLKLGVCKSFACLPIRS